LETRLQFSHSSELRRFLRLAPQQPAAPGGIRSDSSRGGG
jgi:hypothetical protein